MPRPQIFRKSRVEPPPPSARDPQRTGVRLGIDAWVAGRCPDSGGACRPRAAPAPKFSINPGVYRRRSLVVDLCFAPAPLTDRYGQNFAPPPRSTTSSHGPTTAHTSQRTRPAPVAPYPPAQTTGIYGQLPPNSHDFLRNPRLRALIGECSQKNEGLSSGTCELSRAWSWRVRSARGTRVFCLAWYACKWQTCGSRLVCV